MRVRRAPQHFVTPSSVWPADEAEKARIMEGYRTKLGSMDCRYFDFGEGTCPFGTSCFYRCAGRSPEPKDLRTHMSAPEPHSTTGSPPPPSLPTHHSFVDVRPSVPILPPSAASCFSRVISSRYLHSVDHSRELLVPPSLCSCTLTDTLTHTLRHVHPHRLFEAPCGTCNQTGCSVSTRTINTCNKCKVVRDFTRLHRVYIGFIQHFIRFKLIWHSRWDPIGMGAALSYA